LRAACIAIRDLVTHRDLVVEDFQLLDQYRRLLVSSRPVMPRRTLSYVSVPWPCTRMPAQQVRQFIVVGEDRTAIAVAAERLGGKKLVLDDAAQGLAPATRAASRTFGLATATSFFPAKPLGATAWRCDLHRHDELADLLRSIRVAWPGY